MSIDTTTSPYNVMKITVVVLTISLSSWLPKCLMFSCLVEESNFRCLPLNFGNRKKLSSP